MPTPVFTTVHTGSINRNAHAAKKGTFSYLVLVPVSYGAIQVAVVVTSVTKSKRVGPKQVLVTTAVHGVPGTVIVLAASVDCDISPSSNVIVIVLAGARTVIAGACCVKAKVYVPRETTYDVVEKIALMEEVLAGTGLEIHISIYSEQVLFVNSPVQHSVTLKVWLRLPSSSGPQPAQSSLPPYQAWPAARCSRMMPPKFSSKPRACLWYGCACHVHQAVWQTLIAMHL